MKINTKIYAAALYEATKDAKGEKLSLAISNFVRLLAKSNLLRYHDKILADYSRIYNEAEGIVEARVTTAFGLDKAEKEKILQFIGQKTGKKVNLKENTDPALLGGLKLQIQDTLIDDSLKARISQLG